MTNTERLKEVMRTVVAGMDDLLSSTLCLETYESLSKKKWNEAASALRSMQEAVDLMDVILNIDEGLETDINDLPAFSNEAINSYSASFGNRCFFQRNGLKAWLKENDEESDDFRFDLDFDIIETTETTETKETKTKKTTKRKRGNTVSIDELVEKK